MAGRRTPGQRAGLTRARIVAAARAVVAEHGVDGLTMRALAERLGVAPNALYSHVADKGALLDALLDDALAEVDATGADHAEPLEGLRGLMADTLRVLMAHPDLVPLYVARQGARGPNASRLGALMLELLQRAGVGAAGQAAAQRVLIVYTIGFAALGTRAPLEPERPVPPAELVDSFDQGLRWLLAGIRSEAAASSRRSSR
jgi:TetR/AcrR family transcriptional regulator, tetracycline repressor protein